MLVGAEAAQTEPEPKDQLLIALRGFCSSLCCNKASEMSRTMKKTGGGRWRGSRGEDSRLVSHNPPQRDEEDARIENDRLHVLIEVCVSELTPALTHTEQNIADRKLS